MAGDIKVAVVSGAISSLLTGTADFTKSGFGTPKACIVILSFDTTDDTSVIDESRVSIGFSDFTNDFCIGHQDEDAATKVDSDSRKSATKSYMNLDVTGFPAIEGTASTITDGVRLTNTNNNTNVAVFATVIMFGGADLKISLDSVSVPSSAEGTQLVTTSIDQDLIFFIGVDIAGEDSSQSGVNNSFGVAHIDTADHTTFVERCMGWASDHNNNFGAPSSIMRNDRCLKILTEVGGDDWGIELSAATTTSYTIRTKDVGAGANMECYALALDLDDRKSKIGSVNSPKLGATWTPNVTLGFTPQYVGMGLTHAQVENTIEIDSDSGALGISSNTGAGEETFHGWYNEFASESTNTNNNFRSRVIDFRDHDVTTVIQDHSHLSFNSGDWTYTINTENETIARKWFYWAIEEAAAGDTPIICALQTYAYTAIATNTEWGHKVIAALQTYTYTPIATALSKGFVLTATLQTYTYTPIATNTLWKHTLIAALQTYTYTPIATNLEWGHTLIAALQTYTYTPIASVLSRQVNLVAALQTYIYTPIATNTLWDHLVTATLQTYTYTPIATGLTKGFTLIAALQTYTYTPIASVLSRQVNLVADLRTYTYTPIATTLSKGFTVIAVTQTYTYTPIATNTLWDHALIAAIQTYTYTPIATNTLWDHALIAALQTYTYTPIATNTLWNHLLTATLQTYTYTPIATNLTKNIPLVVTTQTYTYTPIATGLSRQVNLVAALQTYIYTPIATNTLWDHLLTATLQTYTITYFATVLTKSGGNQTIACDLRTYTYSPVATNTLWKHTLIAALRTYTYTPIATVLAKGFTLIAALQTYTYTPIATNLLLGRVIVAALQTYTYTPIAIGLSRQVNLVAALQTYTYTPIATGLSRQVNLVAALQTYTYTPIATNLLLGRVLTVDLQAYTYTPIATNILWKHTLIAALQTYTYTPIATGLSRQVNLVAVLQTYTYTPIATNTLWNHTLIAAIRTYTYTPIATNLEWGHTLIATLKTYTYIPIDAILTKSGVGDTPIVCTLQTYAYTPIATNLEWGHTLTATLQTYTYTPVAVTLNAGFTLVADRSIYFASPIMDRLGPENFNFDDNFGSGLIGFGNSFTGNGQTIDEIDVELRKTSGSPAGDVIVEIYDHTGTFGSSSLPGSTLHATSDAINANTFPEIPRNVETFTFSTPFTTVKDTKYCWLCVYEGTGFIEIGFGFAADHPGNNFRDVGTPGSPSYQGLNSTLIFEIRSLQTDANLLWDHVIPATLQTYTYTPIAAALQKGFTLVAALQTYTYTPIATTLTKNIPLVAALQTYTYTPIAAALSKGSLLIADLQTYTYTPIATNTLWGHALIAALQTYIYTPIDTNLNKGSTLIATLQTYTYTPNATVLRTGFFIPLTVQTYTYTPIATVLRRGKKLVADLATYVFTGIGADLFDSGEIRTLLHPSVRPFSVVLTDRVTGIKYDIDRTPGNFVKLTTYTQQFGERKYDPFPAFSEPHINPPGGKVFVENGVAKFEKITDDQSGSDPINNPTVFRDEVYSLEFKNEQLTWDKFIYIGDD